jgi:hypothetical protein
MLKPPAEYDDGAPMPAEPNAMTAGDATRTAAKIANANAKRFIFT